jgi:hypothetical protein
LGFRTRFTRTRARTCFAQGFGLGQLLAHVFTNLLDFGGLSATQRVTTAAGHHRKARPVE